MVACESIIFVTSSPRVLVNVLDILLINQNVPDKWSEEAEGCKASLGGLGAGRVWRPIYA